MPLCANPECQKEFIPNKYARNQIFCSEECSNRVWNNKCNSTQLKTPEQLEKLKAIAERQQDFSQILILKEACEVCGSKEHLLLHEVSYQPLETITLCSSCHGILHHRFLRNKKVKPRYENGNTIRTF